MNAHLLVVDDEPINLEIIEEYLDGSGCSADYCDSGEAAWEALDQNEQRYEAVLLDRMMPGLDGMTLLRRIKPDPRFATLPVIMQTAACSPEQIREGLEAGAYYYLTKPYEREGLLAIIRAALADAQQRRLMLRQEAERWRGIGFLQEAHFLIRSLEDAGQLAAFLAQACPRPDTAQLGLAELMLNAIEHGNLGITYAQKASLKQQDSWHQEVSRRAALPENRDKQVSVRVSRQPGLLQVCIEDQGSGFDWAPYLEFSPERAFDPNGRGIALARMMSFAALEYQGRGNVVVASIALLPEGNTP